MQKNIRESKKIVNKNFLELSQSGAPSRSRPQTAWHSNENHCI